MKKIISLGLAAIMLLGVFAMAGCGQTAATDVPASDTATEQATEEETIFDLAEYKEEAKAELEAYAAAKDPENYTEENWIFLLQAMADGMAAIDASTSKNAIDEAIDEAKGEIDIVKQREFINMQNVKFYDHYEQALDMDSLIRNIIAVSTINGVLIDPDDGQPWPEQPWPSTRTYIIKNEQEWYEKFPSITSTVNFESKMIVVYFFPDPYWHKPDTARLTNVYLEDDVLIIFREYFPKYTSTQPDVAAPQMRVQYFEMDKLNIVDVKFMSK